MLRPQASRRSSLLAFLGMAALAATLISAVTGAWIQWPFLLAAMVVQVRTAARSGTTARERKRRQ